VALRILLVSQAGPVAGDVGMAGNGLPERVVAGMAVPAVAADQPQRLDDRLVGGVVGAELEHFQ
jgi:hypothetical protein